MEIRDVIHGSIVIGATETGVIDSLYFQRLRKIKQLGFAENSFPGATHNRFSHSLGAMHLAGLVFDTIFRKPESPLKLTRSTASKSNRRHFQRLRTAVRFAALLHDIGHGPLSHTTEFAMPPLKDLQLDSVRSNDSKKNRRATHEDYTLKIILESPLTPILHKALKPLDISPRHIASILNDDVAPHDDFFIIDGINYRPILHQMVSSEIDVDRMDYLSRDSYYCGVNYGKFDLAWLVSSLTSHIENDHCYLTLGHKAIYTFEDFLISRLHMFMIVYFHHKTVIYDEMLAQYLASEDCAYQIPSDIDAYALHDDYFLYTHLNQTKNQWAKRIAEKKPLELVGEFTSGMPHTKIGEQEYGRSIRKLTQTLSRQEIPFLEKESSSELSKYISGTERTHKLDPLFVRYDDKFTTPRAYRLEDCTNLYQNYSRNRTVTRIYAAR